MPWWVFALLSAVAAAATAILAKLGVKDVPSHLATAIRTVVVVVFAWGLAFATREHAALRDVSRRALVFLVLSGVATAVSWLAYFRALALAPVSRVAPVDKLSVALTVVFAALLLGEPVSARVAIGTCFIVIGVVLTIAP